MNALILPFDGHNPQVPATAWIAPTATVIGRVTLGERASVFYGAVLRGDRAAITLGSGTNIQDNVTVHADPGSDVLIGDRVSVGHNAVVHGCRVGDDSLIGMGAVVLNGAEIGAGSLIAAGTVVPEGMVVPPGSLVAGVPGRVRRELTDADHERVRRNASTYLTLSAAHALLDD